MRRGSGRGMSVGMGGWREGCWSFLGGWIFWRAEGKFLIRDDGKGNILHSWLHEET